MNNALLEVKPSAKNALPQIKPLLKNAPNESDIGRKISTDTLIGRGDIAEHVIVKDAVDKDHLTSHRHMRHGRAAETDACRRQIEVAGYVPTADRDSVTFGHFLDHG